MLVARDLDGGVGDFVCDCSRGCVFRNQGIGRNGPGGCRGEDIGFLEVLPAICGLGGGRVLDEGRAGDYFDGGGVGWFLPRGGGLDAGDFDGHF